MSSEKPENKTQHLHILMSPSEVTAIDDWGFANRIRTRGEAIRRLCQIGMTFDARSEDFGRVSHAALDIFAKRLPALVIRGGTTSQDDLAEMSAEDMREVVNAAGMVNASLLLPLLEIFDVLETLRHDRSAEAIAGAITLLKAYRDRKEADKAEVDDSYRRMFGETSEK